MIQKSEVTSKNFTIQWVLSEERNYCEVLLQFFPNSIQVKLNEINKTKKYDEFKERAKKIEKMTKTLKRKRTQ